MDVRHIISLLWHLPPVGSVGNSVALPEQTSMTKREHFAADSTHEQGFSPDSPAVSPLTRIKVAESPVAVSNALPRTQLQGVGPGAAVAGRLPSEKGVDSPVTRGDGQQACFERNAPAAIAIFACSAQAWSEPASAEPTAAGKSRSSDVTASNDTGAPGSYPTDAALRSLEVEERFSLLYADYRCGRPPDGVAAVRITLMSCSFALLGQWLQPVCGDLDLENSDPGNPIPPQGHQPLRGQLPRAGRLLPAGVRGAAGRQRSAG